MFRPITPHIHRISGREHAGKIASAVAIIAVAAFLIVVPFPLDAAVIAAPVAGLILLTQPFLIPLGLIASVPVQDSLPVPAGVPVTATRAFVAAALAIIPVLLLRSVQLRFSSFMLLPAVYVAVIAVSLWNASVPSLGYAELYRWVIAIFAFWLVIQFVRTRAQVILAGALFAVLAFAQGIVGGLQATLGIGPESFEIGMGLSRAYGTFGMPNSYAAYMEAVTLPLIPLLVWSLGRFRERLSAYQLARLRGYVASAYARRQLTGYLLLSVLIAAGVACGMVGLVLSFSRGGWLGTIAALAVMIVLLGRRTIVTSAVAAVAFFTILMVGASGTVISVLDDRFSQIIEQATIGDIRGVPITSENFATLERMAHWQAAIAMWDQNFWLGIGAGNFDERFREFTVHPRFIDSQGHAHNYYLHALAETGLLGLIAYLAILVAALVIGWRAYRSKDALARAVGIGAIGVTVALIVHNVFENLHVLNISIQLLAVWALAVVVTRWSDQYGPNEADSPRPVLYDSGRETSSSAASIGRNESLENP